MNIPELRYIVALARERHFGRAAAACFVSQPTLSVAVKKLEAELGTVLFERASQEVRVTATGQQVIEKAQQALEILESIRQTALTEADPLASPLRLGAIFTIGPYLFPDLIVNLRDSAPQMPLLVEENYTSVLTEKLKNGDLDVIIISLPYRESNILTLPLYEEPLVFVLPAAHPLTHRERLQSDDIEGEPILMLGNGHCLREQIIEACPACAPRSNHAGGEYTAEGSSLETIRHMVASGMGLTVMPCSAAGADRYSERLLEIRRFADPEPCRVVALAWRTSFTRPGVIDVLRDTIAASRLACTRSITKDRDHNA
jgi:LysR family hydrogen peroxide-inducible transcriptional activator